jgi:hypothetical protein
MNPEILGLYGVTRRIGQRQRYLATMQTTRYALLIANDTLVMPASYLFEVDIIDQILVGIQVLIDMGLVYVASPTADLLEYVQSKRREYRDEAGLFVGYVDERSLDRLNDVTPLWIPRIRRSASGDIRTAWRHALYLPDGIWMRILRAARKRAGVTASKLEDAIYGVPDQLEGRAFIFRYAERRLPIHLEPDESTEIAMMISRAYLWSYLEEYDAAILIDTPLGALDCGLPPENADGALRTVSYRQLARFLRYIGINEYIDNRLDWYSLTQVREHPAFQELLGMALVSAIHFGRPLSDALRLSRYRPEPQNHAIDDREILREVEDRLWRALDAVSPYFVWTPPTRGGGDLRRPEVAIAVSKEQGTHLPPYVVQPYLIRTGGTVANNKVFLIHGRDSRAVESMKDLLLAAGLSPIEWQEACNWTAKPNPHNLEVVRAGLEHAQALLVLFTPDEEVTLRGQFVPKPDARREGDLGHQPRPNVLVEAGMALAIDERRTVIVEIGTMRDISDLQGLNVLRFDGSGPQRQTLMDRLMLAGCTPRLTGGAFLTKGFEYLR